MIIIEFIVQNSALCLEGHCTSCFKRVVSREYFMSPTCGCPQEGVGLVSCGQGEGSRKLDFLVDVING